ncbi:Hypothetical protein FKW44_005581, partial [Caligus rogercresseyi]
GHREYREYSRWAAGLKNNTAVDSLPVAYWGLYKAGEGIIVLVDKFFPLRPGDV